MVIIQIALRKFCQTTVLSESFLSYASGVKNPQPAAKRLTRFATNCGLYHSYIKIFFYCLPITYDSSVRMLECSSFFPLQSSVLELAVSILEGEPLLPVTELLVYYMYMLALLLDEV